MKQPELRNTTNRDEMMCPRCDTEGLEENPAYADEYAGRTALLKSTRCPNPDCEYHYGVPQRDVEIQMPDKSISDSIPNIIPSEINAGVILRGMFILIGLFVVVNQFGLIPFGGDSPSETGDDIIYSNISGEIANFDGESDIQLALYKNNEEYRSNILDSNTFNFEDIEQGDYMLYLENENLNMNPDGKEINVSQEDISDIELINENNTPYEINQTIQNATINFDYSNPSNKENIVLNLYPIQGDNIQRSHTIHQGEERTILMPLEPNSEQINVESDITTVENTNNYQYLNEEQNIDIDGNINAENLDITLTNDSISDTQSETFDIREGGQIETININSNETAGPIQVTLRDGTSQTRQQSTGVWNNENNISIYTGLEERRTGNIQLTPQPEYTNETNTGVLSDSVIPVQFDGNQPVDDLKIIFDGGDSESEVIGEEEIMASAENGSTGEITRKLVDIPENSNYNLNIQPELIQNNNLINLYYVINGEKTQISNTEEIDKNYNLNENDTVELVAEAKRDTVSDDENPPSFSSIDDNIDIKELSFDESNPDVGDTITVNAILENNANHDITEELEFYVNGNQFASRSYTIPSNSEKQIGGVNELGNTVVDEEGTNVIFINDRGPYFIEVGDSEPEFGEATLSATIQDLRAEGQVSVDTNNDGDYDCIVLASDGECSFDGQEFDTNSQHDILFNQEGVSNTNYELKYTSKLYPEDINLDVRENNITDYTNEGVLSSTETGTIELVPNNMSIGFDTGNDIPIEYSITWDADSVIDNPVLYVDNEDTEINDLGSFREDKTFELPPLTQGEHELEFLSSSGGYTVDLNWIEDEDQSYPSTLLNNNEVCSSIDFANNLTCSITDSSLLNIGSNTLDFSTEDSFNYQLLKKNRVVADDIYVDINGNREQFTRPTSEPEKWEDVLSTNNLQRGENNISVNSSIVNNIQPNSTAEIQYSIDTGSVENPELLIINDNDEQNEIDLSSAMESDEFVNELEVEIQENWLTKNNNTIQLRTESGVFELQGEIKTSESNIQFTSDD